MQSVFQVLKNAAVALLWFGIGYAVFFYVAHFTVIQSLLLSVVGLCAVDGYKLAVKIATNQEPKFEPFWVSVEPNWCSICSDFGLAAGERWTELQEKCKAAPANYSVIRNGLNFTMLSPALFYSNDDQTFFGELDLKMSIEELRSGLLSFVPQFYVKRTLAGEKKNLPVIEFGLVTQESLRKSSHPRDENANIAIGWLPEIVFFGFTHPDAYNWNTMKKIEEQTKGQLTDFGWTQKGRDPEDSWLRWPLEINHRYFRVRYRGIS